MLPTEYLALGTLITVSASALALIIKQIESSKCSDISCFCFKCKRQPELKTQDASSKTPIHTPRIIPPLTETDSIGRPVVNP
jgi:hypothetical protein